MSEGQSLDEILGSDTPQEEVHEEAQPSTDNRPRDEHGRFLPKQTGDEPEPQGEPESVTPTPEPQEERIPIAALKDERSKRQQLEQRLQEYEQYFAQLQQAPRQPAQPQEEPDMFADPEGFKAHLAAQIRQELLKEVQPTIQQSQIMTRAEVSEIMARQKYEDYDATVEQFKEALATNPFLLSQLQQAADPATFAYNAGKQWAAAKNYGSEAPPSREQIEAEVEARLREKIMGEIGLDRPKVPTTLAGDRSVGSRSGPAWTGPKPLGDLLG